MDIPDEIPMILALPQTPYAIFILIIGLTVLWFFARRKPKRPYYLNDFHGDPGWQQQHKPKSKRR